MLNRNSCAQGLVFRHKFRYMSVMTRHLAPSRRFPIAAALALLAALAVGGCGSDRSAEALGQDIDAQERQGVNDPGKLFGDEGILLLGASKRTESVGSGIAVNSFLWRASLDTLSFMPLNSADPFGGVIITDWYAPPESPDRRFKANIYILDRRLRADGIRVAVFQQSRNASGQWATVEVKKKTVSDLENTILTRARQLRIASARQ
jgi:hypothetical protein